MVSLHTGLAEERSVGGSIGGCIPMQIVMYLAIEIEATFDFP